MTVNNGLEITGAGLGLIGVWLASRNHPSSWWFQLPACLLYTWIFYHNHLYADSLLQVWFFLSSLYGLKNWQKAGQATLPISRMKASEWPQLIFTNLIGLTLLYCFLSPVGQAKWLGLDALCAVLSVTAQRLLVRRKIENWIFWMLVNCLYLWLYWKSSLYYTFIFYAILLAMAVKAWITWRKKLTSLPR